MNRVKLAGEALVTIFEELFPGSDVVRTYTPNRESSEISGTNLTIFITPEDVATEIKNHDGTRFTDRITFTICVAQRIADIIDATAETDTLIENIQKIRDYFRLKIRTENGLRIFTPSAEHSASRPLYAREKLEVGNIFVGLLFLEVQVDGFKE